MNSPRIAVLGSYMHAQCWHAQRLPASGESISAHGFSTAPAGKGLAVAVGCRRLGAEVDLLLAIGDDVAGDRLLTLLDAEGLHARYVQRFPGPSGQGAGWLADDGSNMIVTFAGANARLAADQVARTDEALSHARVVYAPLEVPQDAVQEAFERGRRIGAWTVLNASPWQSLDASLLAHIDVLLVNEGEARQLFAAHGGVPARARVQDWQRAAAGFWTDLPDAVARGMVLTLGEQGSLVLMPGGQHEATPASQVPVVDSMGAGDAFAAGLCTALAEGQSLQVASRRANACGAFAVQQRGILEGLPRTGEIQP